MEKDYLIYDYDYLGLSNEHRKIAENILSKCDMPIVFWINSNCEFNERHRHPHQENQYWVTIKPQRRDRERIRLILAGIRCCYQEQERIPCFMPKLSYVDSFKDNYERVNKLKEYIARMNSVVRTLEVRCYLRQYGIETNKEVSDECFEDIIKKLKEYIKLNSKKKGKPSLIWYRELRACNMMIYAEYYIRNFKYKIEIEKHLKLLDAKYLNKVKRLARLFKDFSNNYDENCMYDQVVNLYTDIIDVLNIEDMLSLYSPYANVAVVKNGNSKVFSYIPSDFNNKELLRLWIRTAREFISAYRESKGYDVPDITLNLIDSKEINSYAEGTNNRYFINFTVGLIEDIFEKVNELDIDKNKFGQFGSEDEMRNQLLRQIIYFITAHEYAHILNGDINEAEKYSIEEKEKRADNKAIESIDDARLLYYRFNPNENNIYTSIEQLEYKLNRDASMLEYAISFVNEYRLKRKIC